MSDELREAAERLSTLSGIGRYMRDQAAVDAVRLAENWLAEHQLDDGEPVTEEWLNCLATDGFNLRYSTIEGVPVLEIMEPKCGEFTLHGYDKRITRGQVRLLLRALQ